jgi:hypothetical protein
MSGEDRGTGCGRLQWADTGWAKAHRHRGLWEYVSRQLESQKDGPIVDLACPDGNGMEIKWMNE